jgi:SNF2 family DNA or RNA helicase
MANGELTRLVKPLILRRLKGDVLDDLPEKTETTVMIELGKAERTAYEGCRVHAIQSLEATAAEGGGEPNRMSILAELTRLRRFCCHPSLVLPNEGLPSAKMEALVDLLANLREGRHRALVFSQFTDYLAIVRKALDARSWSYLYLDGSTPTSERSRLVEAFQSGEGDFFVISLKAGGTGLNLTAADYVILLDPWWNPAVENQAADRVHRIGQKHPVTVYRLIAADTVEERVLELHKEKRQIAEDVLDGTGSASLSPAQLMGLFRSSGQ